MSFYINCHTIFGLKKKLSNLQRMCCNKRYVIFIFIWLFMCCNHNNNNNKCITAKCYSRSKSNERHFAKYLLLRIARTSQPCLCLRLCYCVLLRCPTFGITTRQCARHMKMTAKLAGNIQKKDMENDAYPFVSVRSRKRKRKEEIVENRIKRISLSARTQEIVLHAAR